MTYKEQKDRGREYLIYLRLSWEKNHYIVLYRALSSNFDRYSSKLGFNKCDARSPTVTMKFKSVAERSKV